MNYEQNENIKNAEQTSGELERLVKQERIIEEQQARIEFLEKQNLYLQKSFDTISNSFFWKVTKPARLTLDILKWLLWSNDEKHIFYRVLKSIWKNGLQVTWEMVIHNVYYSNNTPLIEKKLLFSEKELKRQRKHTFNQKIKFSIVVPLYNTPESFLREMIESVQAQTYGEWELCIVDGSDQQHSEVEEICRSYIKQDNRICYKKLERNLGISRNTNACLEMAKGDYIGLFDHDDLLHPAALYEVMRTIERTGADFIYTDESIFYDKPEKASIINFKPDFAPDSLRGNNFICHFTVFKHSLLDEVGLFDPACDGSQDHDMVLRLTEKAKRIAHIPEILYYWRAHEGSVAESSGAKPYAIQAGIRAVQKQLERLGLEGTVDSIRPGLPVYRVRYVIHGTPKVSILIPNYEHLEDLKKCLTSIFEKTTWPSYEIVIVENNSTSQELFSYYERLQKEHGNVQVVTWKEEFNYSAINNYGAQFCDGEYLLLLNNDITVITPDWIQEMLMFAQRPDVGAVGAMLYYPNDTIQHAGVIIGIGGVAGHSHKYFSRGENGYMSRLLYAQNLSAVTAACMMISKEVWNKVGGLDETLKVAFNDVDLCMRIRKAGLLIVWTPFAELYHHESISRGQDDTPEKKRRLEDETCRFQRKWIKELKAGDPYYNPNLTVAMENFSIGPELQRHNAR